MDDDKKRGAKFSKEVKAQKRRKKQLQNDAAKQTKTILNDALKHVREVLSNEPTEWDVFYLSQVEKNIKTAMDGAANKLSKVAATETSAAWIAGQELIDAPLLAGGIKIKAVLPEIDKGQLDAIRTFMTGRLRDVGTDLALKINSELGLVVVGAQGSGDAKKKIASLIGKKGKARATTIVRTEIGRVYSSATQKRQEQAKEVLPGLKKQWRRSGKLHSRKSHDLADGQIVEVDQPFIIGGVPLMFPRDPAGSPRETINCGCDNLPIMESWKVKQPGRKPFSEEETMLNNLKRDMNAGLIKS